VADALSIITITDINLTGGSVEEHADHEEVVLLMIKGGLEAQT
jgi:hypothetical protein